MRCPFCNAELKNGKYNTVISCFETDCSCNEGFTYQVYNALTSSKVTQNKLKELQSTIQSSFKREKDGFLVNWDIVARVIMERIEYMIKSEGSDANSSTEKKSKLL